MAVVHQDNLDCPICFEIPEKEIYQCENGHTFCVNCEKHLSICPQCKVNVGKPKIRCRALENLMDNMKFDCDFKKEGCRSKVSRSEISSHGKICSFGPNGRTSICKALGYTCGHVVDSKNLSKTVAHFKNDHDFILTESTNLDIRLAGFSSELCPGARMWTPIVIDGLTTEGRLFVILCLLDGAEQSMLSFVCLYIQDEHKATRKLNLAFFGIEAPYTHTNPYVIWSTQPVDANFAGMTISEPFLRTPQKMLEENFAVNAFLLVKFAFAESLEKSRENKQTKLLTTYSMPRKIVDTKLVIPTKKVSRFIGFRCDSCKRYPITNILYTCIQCSDLNLCEFCIDGGKHAQHVLVTTKTFKQAVLFLERWHRFLSDPFMWNTKAGTLTGAESRCSQCAQQKMYVCLNCKQLTGYCKPCFGTTNHSEDHIFAFAPDTKKMQLIVTALRANDFEIDMVISQFASRFLK